jgi:Leucine-rich repeat (LRR) protein
MKKYLGVLLFLFIDSRIGYCVTNCKQKDSWLCFSAQKWHLECPCTFTDDINSKDYKNGGFVIDINGRESMSIDCYDVKKIYMNMLPNITVDRIENFRLRFCPLPDRFKQVLDWLSIKDVKKLQFENSRVKNITLKKDYFESLDRLESLNLIGLNGLEVLDDTFVNTPKLLILDFQRISNLHLTPKLFKNIPLLKWLTIVESELEEIPDGFFENLENLQKLHLWSNNLTTLQESVFSNLARLKSLELSSNKIENIENGAFDNLTQLLTVSLAKNNLSSVPATLFAQNKKLEKIRMGHNVDLVLSDYFFSNLWSLKEVDLTNCQLKSLPEHVFENSTNLETLNLQRNKLTNLSEITFRLEKLKVLILRKNLISYLDGNTFKYLSSLENVDLEGNFITFIHHRTFCNKNLLKVINLSHNQYRGLDKLNLLECVPNLEEINFSYNFLARVTDVISGPLEKLRRLDLRHNFITEVFVGNLLLDFKSLERFLSAK